jgi:hypothetical protein
VRWWRRWRTCWRTCRRRCRDDWSALTCPLLWKAATGALFPELATRITMLLQVSLMVHDPRNNTNGPRTYTKNTLRFVLIRALLWCDFVDRMACNLSMLSEV